VPSAGWCCVCTFNRLINWGIQRYIVGQLNLYSLYAFHLTVPSAVCRTVLCMYIQ